jgi:hypothetical protein
MKNWILVAASALVLAACQGETGPAGADGATGQPGLGYVPLEPAGVVGLVKDTAGEPVAGATVYLVPNTDIPTAAIDLSSITTARASTVDEPLEDTIAANGAGYASAVTDANGIYRIASVPSGRHYVTVIPAAADDAHLPGGSLCRASLQDSALVGKQVDIKVSTKPSSSAEFVGPSVCLQCHGVVHEMQTLHMNGIRVVGETGPLQNDSRFPSAEWNAPLAKFEADTVLYFYAYDAAKKDWKVSETDPGAGVSFTARLFLDVDGKYKVTLADVKGNSPAPVTYVVELSYGGGLYKQRWLTKLANGSRYVLPLQFNTQGQPTSAEATTPSGRWTWVQYNAGNWYVEDTTTPANSHLKEPAPEKSFDNACAGCHFTGYTLNGNLASAVPDERGEYDYDGDGLAENMNISCETCHGPGSEHWYRAGNGRSIVSPSLLTPEREVNLCAQCHTRAIGNGGLQAGTPAAYTTEAPLDSNNRMMVAGTSRADFLAHNVSKIDDGLWTVAAGGDDLHSVKHHQQASDFIKSKKYRNPYDLLTCATCHDVHGNSGLPHQLQQPLDASGASYSDAGTAGLCLSCHEPYLNGYPAPAGLTVGQRMQDHWAGQGIADAAMGDIQCVDCHMPKTAKSGSGLKQGSIAGTQYWSGDISSHVFDVPLRADITNKSSGMMPIAYTNACGVCHTAAP